MHEGLLPQAQPPPLHTFNMKTNKPKRTTTSKKPDKMKTQKPEQRINPDDYICTSSLGYREVQREVQRFEMTQRMDTYGFDASRSRYGLDVRTFMDHATQQMILQLQAKILSKKFDVKTVRFPDGAWQFIKFNLANSQARGIGLVQWFLKRYPVRYVEVTMEANAYHPDIAIPDHDTYVNIAISAKRNGY